MYVCVCMYVVVCVCVYLFKVKKQGNSCAELASSNGFDCSGCICEKELKECTNYGNELHSCDYWIELNVGQTCPDLESKHGYDCSGCKKCTKN